jgi:hypothetical protein
MIGEKIMLKDRPARNIAKKGLGRLYALIRSDPALIPNTQECRFNAMLDTYPSNHVYSIRQGQLKPGKQLAKRVSFVQRFYPEPMESLLDIGCAQGYFVMDCAKRFPVSRSLGIDVDEKYIQTANEITAHLRLPNARFARCYLGELSENLDAFGGPFQTVLFLNTYHYLYFGSGKDSFAYRNHRHIFQMLRSVTSFRVIFSSPLEIQDCPSFVQKLSREGEYTEKAIFDAAGEFFTLEKIGKLANRPACVLTVLPNRSKIP